MSRAPAKPTNPRVPGGFTLTELLIVMGVIAALSVLTLVSMRAIAKDARMASATNTVTASLENARALAMKKNGIVLIIFRPRIDGVERVVVDIVTCRWTGESFRNEAPALPALMLDRFVPIPDAPLRTLPPGIKVAGPSYLVGEDHVWATQSHLPAVATLNEVPGVVVGVMYGPDGTTITGNPQSDASLIWADLFVDLDSGETNPVTAVPKMRLGGDGTWYSLDAAPRVFLQSFEDDEPFVVIAPFLAVYDDDEARELGRTDQWSTQAIYEQDLVGVPDDPDYRSYITDNANRIHFNRYTGVVMK